MSVVGIVVAAGSGQRFGRPKATLEVRGRPLWQWAADALRDGGCGSVIVVGEVPGGVPGGPRRRDSVAAGLAMLPEGTTHVLVHDAARPLASADLVRRVIARLQEGSADAVVPAIAVRDTIKRVAGEVVEETIERSGLFAVQTPQGFSCEVLVAAHATHGEDATDDAALVERHGGTVVVVPGEEHNVKVTFPDDLRLVEMLAP